MPTPETERDNLDAAYFRDGWQAALREVIATAKHRGSEAAVDWAETHYSPEGQAPKT